MFFSSNLLISLDLQNIDLSGHFVYRAENVKKNEQEIRRLRYVRVETSL